MLRWDLTWVGWIDSYINDLFLQGELYHYGEILLMWDVSMVGWFFLYKPLLKIYFWWYKNRQVAENYFSVKFYIAFCLMINTIKSFEQLCCEEKVLNVEYDI